ncbi:MAG: M15 family metallopeptidase [Nitrosomonadales bacterium]|nr:M15 family metallopeptidase [Nitrosomonadales bacterium]
MIDSRDLNDLSPAARKRAQAFFASCAADSYLLSNGITVIATSTYRDFEAQDAIYARGRTAPGKVVTKAKAGDSWHNWRCAFDVLPLRCGKPVWGTTGADGEVWRKLGEIGEACGLEWAGRWTTFRELAHFQYTGGLTLADFKAGKTMMA